MPRFGPDGKPLPRIVFAHRPEEKARWDEDARLMGFNHCGAAYIRWLLDGRVTGRVLILDPATATFGAMIGRVFGEAAGSIIAKVERMYLEGK